MSTILSYSLIPPAIHNRPSAPHARGPSIATLSAPAELPREVDVAEATAATEVGVSPTPAVEPLRKGEPKVELAMRRDE
jgi:hypothetical protein